MKYDFNRSYRHFYSNHNYDIRLRQKYECSPQSDPKRYSLSCENNSRQSRPSFSEHRSKEDYEISTNNSRDNSSTDRYRSCKLSPIWCIDYSDNLIVIGCADGRMEFWESSTGEVKVRNNLLRECFVNSSQMNFFSVFSRTELILEWVMWRWSARISLQLAFLETWSCISCKLITMADLSIGISPVLIREHTLELDQPVRFQNEKLKLL